MPDYKALLLERTKLWTKVYAPATPEQIQLVRKWGKGRLPEDYLQFFLFSNGAYGEIPVSPYWCDLFEVQDVVQANTDYQVTGALPDHFAIGTSGGGEILILNLAGKPCRVETVPVLGLELDYVEPVANSFIDFILMIGDVSPEFADEDLSS